MRSFNAASFEGDPSQRPLLVFKTGMCGGVELGFMDALGELMDGDVFNIEDTKVRLHDNTEPEKRMSSGKAKVGLMRELTPSLVEGVDVFAEVSFNTEQSRKSYPIRVADNIGAVSVAINVVNPDLRVVRNRLLRWEDDHEATLPPRYYETTLDQFIGRTTGHLVYTDPHEVDYAITIDGSTALDDSVAQVMSEFDRLGIEPL